ncbi:MAG: DUF4292 domain-containing protein [Prevotellaceae bacterium]|nr:DUF4292 domain-containing protein [Prevotellaceae bacterium]
MRRYKSLIYVLAFTLALAGCRSSHNATQGGATGQSSLVNGRNTSVNSLTAKMKLSLEAGGKSISLGGTYRLLRDDVVQINLTYSVLIVSMNVGTMELTKDSILIIDRMEKRYCRVAYKQIAPLREAGVDFDYLQRVFWGDAADVTNKYVSWSYGSWLPLSDGQFPQELSLTLKDNNSKQYKATFTLSKVQETSDWDTRTSIPSGYEEVTGETVMKAIMSVAK